MQMETSARDVFLRHTGTEGKSHVFQHRLWVRDSGSLGRLIAKHQGLAEDGTLTKKDIFTGNILDPQNNSSVLPAPPLFTAFDQRCDLQEARINPGDTLYGQKNAIQADISYTTFLTFQSQVLTSSKVAPTPGYPDNICGNLDKYILVTPTLTPRGSFTCKYNIFTSQCEARDNCGDLYWEPANPTCVLTRPGTCTIPPNPSCIQFTTPAPEQVPDCNGPYVNPTLSPNGPWPTPGGACQEFASCICTLNVDDPFGMADAYTCQGTNPDRPLPSEARVGVLTKTPFVERLYETLVGASNSVLRRFIPGPNTPPDCDAACMDWAFQQYLPHGPGTLPAGTPVTYTGSFTGGNPLTNPGVSAGAGGGAACPRHQLLGVDLRVQLEGLLLGEVPVLHLLGASVRHRCRLALQLLDEDLLQLRR